MKEKTVGEATAESFLLACLLTVAGGFLDAYTYCCRDQVFANAQTGNVVRVGISLALGAYDDVIRYLIPIFAFFCGVCLAMAMRDRFGEGNRSLWRQRILLLEIAVAAVVSLIPTETILNILSNILVSFLCALQAESFRKVGGKTFASTMCTGNLRSCAECFYRGIRNRDSRLRKDAAEYLGIILTFVSGAVIGVHVSGLMGKAAILSVILPLGGALALLKWKKET